MAVCTEEMKSQSKKHAYDVKRKIYLGQVLQPTYSREIPVQTLPKGAVMFHYCTFPQIIPGENMYSFTARFLDVFLGQFGYKIVYNSAIDYFELCFSKNVANYHYYYPNPCAGFGVNGWGGNFNAAVICYSQRETKWAYLKGGTSVKNSVVQHRRDCPAGYDVERTMNCNNPQLDRPCKPGQGYDICLSPSFIKDNKIDGITSIAAMDGLCTITDPGWGPVNYNTEKSMFQALREWKSQLRNDNAIDKMLWALNLASIETDYRPSSNRLEVGFREYSCLPAGHQHYDDDFFPNNMPGYELPYATYGPPPTNPPPYGTRNIWGIKSYERDHANRLVNITYQILPTHLKQFCIDYIFDKLVFRPAAFVTSYGIANIHDVLLGTMFQDIITKASAGHMPLYYNVLQPPAAMNAELRYNMNNNIGRWLNERINEENSRYVFDFKFNIMFRNHFYQQNKTLPMKIKKLDNSTDAAMTLTNALNSVVINTYNTPLIEEYKIVHELYSNVFFKNNWMNIFKRNFTNKEYERDGTIIREIEYVVIGPFYNMLYMPRGGIDITNECIQTYQTLIFNLETGVNLYGVRQWDNYTSFTKNLLLNPDAAFVQKLNYLKQRMNTNTQKIQFSPGGPQYDHRFRKIYMCTDGAHKYDQDIQLGGYIKNTLNNGMAIGTYNKPDINSTQNNKLNKTKKAIKINKQSRKLSKSKTNKNSKVNLSIIDGGHASPNITPLLNEHINLFEYLQSNKTLADIFASAFVEA